MPTCGNPGCHKIWTKNHATACSFHVQHRQHGYYKSGVQRVNWYFWPCCGSREENAPGCVVGPHVPPRSIKKQKSPRSPKHTKIKRLPETGAAQHIEYLEKKAKAKLRAARREYRRAKKARALNRKANKLGLASLPNDIESEQSLPYWRYKYKAALSLSRANENDSDHEPITDYEDNYATLCDRETLLSRSFATTTGVTSSGKSSTAPLPSLHTASEGSAPHVHIPTEEELRENYTVPAHLGATSRSVKSDSHVESNLGSAVESAETQLAPRLVWGDRPASAAKHIHPSANAVKPPRDTVRAASAPLHPPPPASTRSLDAEVVRCAAVECERAVTYGKKVAEAKRREMGVRKALDVVEARLDVAEKKYEEAEVDMRLRLLQAEEAGAVLKTILSEEDVRARKQRKKNMEKTESPKKKSNASVAKKTSHPPPLPHPILHHPRAHGSTHSQQPRAPHPDDISMNMLKHMYDPSTKSVRHRSSSGSSSQGRSGSPGKEKDGSGSVTRTDAHSPSRHHQKDKSHMENHRRTVRTNQDQVYNAASSKSHRPASASQRPPHDSAEKSHRPASASQRPGPSPSSARSVTSARSSTAGSDSARSAASSSGIVVREATFARRPGSATPSKYAKASAPPSSSAQQNIVDVGSENLLRDVEAPHHTVPDNCTIGDESLDTKETLRGSESVPLPPQSVENPSPPLPATDPLSERHPINPEDRGEAVSKPVVAGGDLSVGNESAQVAEHDKIILAHSSLVTNSIAGAATEPESTVKASGDSTPDSHSKPPPTLEHEGKVEKDDEVESSTEPVFAAQDVPTGAENDNTHPPESFDPHPSESGLLRSEDTAVDATADSSADAAADATSRDSDDAQTDNVVKADDDTTEAEAAAGAESEAAKNGLAVGNVDAVKMKGNADVASDGILPPTGADSNDSREGASSAALEKLTSSTLEQNSKGGDLSDAGNKTDSVAVGSEESGPPRVKEEDSEVQDKPEIVVTAPNSPESCGVEDTVPKVLEDGEGQHNVDLNGNADSAEASASNSGVEVVDPAVDSTEDGDTKPITEPSSVAEGSNGAEVDTSAASKEDAAKTEVDSSEKVSAGGPVGEADPGDNAVTSPPADETEASGDVPKPLGSDDAGAAAENALAAPLTQKHASRDLHIEVPADTWGTEDDYPNSDSGDSLFEDAIASIIGGSTPRQSPLASILSDDDLRDMLSPLPRHGSMELSDVNKSPHQADVRIDGQAHSGADHDGASVKSSGSGASLFAGLNTVSRNVHPTTGVGLDNQSVGDASASEGFPAQSEGDSLFDGFYKGISGAAAGEEDNASTWGLNSDRGATPSPVPSKRGSKPVSSSRAETPLALGEDPDSPSGAKLDSVGANGPAPDNEADKGLTDDAAAATGQGAVGENLAVGLPAEHDNVEFGGDVRASESQTCAADAAADTPAGTEVSTESHQAIDLRDASAENMQPAVDGSEPTAAEEKAQANFDDSASQEKGATLEVPVPVGEHSMKAEEVEEEICANYSHPDISPRSPPVVVGAGRQRSDSSRPSDGGANSGTPYLAAPSDHNSSDVYALDDNDDGGDLFDAIDADADYYGGGGEDSDTASTSAFDTDPDDDADAGADVRSFVNTFVETARAASERNELPENTDVVGSSLTMRELMAMCAATTPFAQAVKRVSIDGTVFSLEGAKALGSLVGSARALSELTLENCSLSFAEVEAVLAPMRDAVRADPRAYQSLSSLWLAKNDIGDACVEILASVVEHLPLEELCLEDNGVGDTGCEALAKALRNIFSLKVLLLGENSFSTRGARALASVLPNWHNSLLEFSLEGVPLDGPCFSEIARALTGCTRLTHLAITESRCTPQAYTDLAAALRLMKRLQSLVLDDCALSDAGLLVVAPALASCRRLKTISLNRNNIGKGSIGSLAASLAICSLLEVVRLNENMIEAEGAAELLRCLSNCSNISVLSLESCDVGDAGARSVSSFLNAHPSLTRVMLSGNDVSDTGGVALVQVLQSLPSNSKLKELWISDNNFTTTTSDLQLAGAKHGVEVYI
eukprot:Rmarinus@m.13095